MHACSFKSLVGVFISLAAVVGVPQIGVAQVISDATLSTEVLSFSGRNFLIQAGEQAEGNLFHSFEQFSIPTGGIAFFNQSPAIENIISRVTGGDISILDGEVRANGTANLFLINPTGVIFGPNASLNIGGSFIATTAQQLSFLDGTELSADSAAAVPQLTISRPLGLRLSENSGPIQVVGRGDSSLLAVRSEQTLALVANGLSLRGATLQARSGRIEMGSLSDGEIRLAPTDTGISLDYDQAASFADIQITDATILNASGLRAGDVQLEGKNIAFSNGSAILSSTFGDEDGGTVTLRADASVTLDGVFQTTGNINAFPSGIYASSLSRASGRGSNLLIETELLQISNGAFVSVSTFGEGDAGDVVLRANTIDISRHVPGLFTPTGIVNQNVRGTGSGGDIFIEAERISLTQGGQLGTSSLGRGLSGNLTIDADVVEVVGTDDSRSIFSTLSTQVNPQSMGGTGGLLTINAEDILVADLGLISAAVAEGGEGQGGTIELNTDSLRILNGAKVTTATLGQGNAGDIRIFSDVIDIQGSNRLNGVTTLAEISAAVNSTATGEGGDIFIVAERLSLSDNGAISNSTFGQGDSGDIEINAREIALTSPSPIENITPSSIRSDTFSVGNAGDIKIISDELTVAENSRISVNSFSTGGSGNLDVAARSARLDRGGRLSAETSAGDRGSISLQVDDLLFLNNGSAITTNARGTATGGNIVVDGGIILLNQESEIVAQAIEGQGGNIQLTTGQLLSSNDSRIDASSQFGIDGTVILDNLTENEPNPTELSDAVITPEQIIANSCLGAGGRDSGQFIISGSGGLSATPVDPSQATFDTYSIPGPETVTAEISQPEPSQQNETMVEAQAAHRLADGRIVLTRGCG